MPLITPDMVADYLRRLLETPVTVHSLVEHGKQELGGELKSYGYGVPLFIDFTAGGERRRAVLETMSPSSFGHEHFSDRAQAVLWEHSAFNDLPRHVRSLDCGAVLRNGSLVSTGAAEEFFLLTEYAEGAGYFLDLERIAKTGTAAEEDRQRTVALADYLASIHARTHDAPGLYVRRVRELIGHGECIMGLIDNYPDRFEFIDQRLLERIETACLSWRWKLRPRVHRLCQVHGDFHPWNILFRSGCDFTVLDRSRGAWGEPADDTTCLSINYLFSSLLRSGRLDGPFETLTHTFWDRYLERTGDREMLEVAAPFLAWRGLVIASPVWYPSIPVSVRQTIFRFIENVLTSGRFEPRETNRYLT